MITERIKKNKGFTLIETIVYIGIVVMVVSSIVSYILSLSGARNKNYSVQSVQANSRTAISVISEKIRESNKVLTPSVGATSDQLVLDMVGNLPNITFSISGGRLVMSEVGNPDVYVTDIRTVVSDFVISNMTVLGERENVNIAGIVSYNTVDGDVENRAVQEIRTSITKRN